MSTTRTPISSQISEHQLKARLNTSSSSVESVGSNDEPVSLENQRRRKFIPNYTSGLSRQDIGGSSRSFGRKRSSSVSDIDAALIEGQKNFNAYIAEKRARLQAFEEELTDCIALVCAMEGLPPALFVKAANKFTSAGTRAVFLSLHDYERRAWVESLNN